MKPLLGISGSLRAASFNTALLRAAQELRPELIEIGDIRGIPLYDGDLEARAVPKAVLELKRKVRAAKGVVLVSPEYNHSVPGVMKNAIDWLSRPSDGLERVFNDKPVAVMGATPGGFGTALAQTAWLAVFQSIGAHLSPNGRLLVSHASKAFDDDRQLQDETISDRLRRFLDDFATFCDV
jgi:NAD(P)H-dependent FMN reductase